MGFSYRKSFKAGPLRITASKSGISYSAGVKGVRVAKRADGRVQTTLSAPGTGIRYTHSSGRPKAKKKAVPPSARAGAMPRSLTGTEIAAEYRRAYEDARKRLAGGETGAALRGALHNRGLTHPKILRAVTDAERDLAREAKKQQDRQRPLEAARADRGREAIIAEAASRLRAGIPHHHVTRWLKREEGVGFFARGQIMTNARKINKDV